MHYFVLFSLILGNVAAVFVGELLKNDKGIAFILGVILVGFSTLFWLISQSRNKIKRYQFWDEVLTFWMYVLCALMVYINFGVLMQIRIVLDQGFWYTPEYSSIIMMSAFVFFSSILVYLIAHTGVRTILGILILHLTVLPFVGVFSGSPMLYVMLFLVLFPLFYFITENNPTYRFIRFFLIPYVPLAVFISSINLVRISDLLKLDGATYLWGWTTILLMLISGIFGSALIVKRNIEPLS